MARIGEKLIDDKDLNDAIEQVQQPRSNFQLAHFVVGQHFTPEMQYYQILLELSDLLYKHQLSSIDAEILEEKIKRKELKNNKIDDLKAKKLRINLAKLKETLTATEKEIDFLYTAWKSTPIKYTREQIEQAQPDYWEKRLVHDVEMQALSGAVNPAHLTSLKQAGILDSFLESRAATNSEEKPSELED